MSYSFLQELVKEKGIVKKIVDFKEHFEYAVFFEKYNKDYRYVSKYGCRKNHAFYKIHSEHLHWDKISSSNLPIQFLREFQDKINWFVFFNDNGRNLNEDVIREFHDKIENWRLIATNLHISINFLRDFQDKFRWDMMDYIIIGNNFNEEIVREFKDLLNWNVISRVPNLSEDFIEEYKDQVNWDWISAIQNLSETFIQKNRNYINWQFLSRNNSISVNFIRENIDNLDFQEISKNIILDEDFIREFQDRLDWDSISSSNAILSDDFLDEFKNKINWDLICKKLLSYEQDDEYTKLITTITRFKDYINIDTLIKNARWSSQLPMNFLLKIKQFFDINNFITNNHRILFLNNEDHILNGGFIINEFGEQLTKQNYNQILI